MHLRLHLHGRQLGLAHLRRALGNLLHPLEVLHHVVEVVGANVVPDLGGGWNHVGLAAPVGDDIVNAGVVPDVLPHQVHAHVHQLHRIQRAATAVGRGGRVGGHASEAKLGVHNRLGGTVAGLGLVARVPGQNDVVVFEVAGPQHIDLANTGFLRGRAV